MVEHAGETVDLGGRRQRAVLVALLLRANKIATAGYLVDAVWEVPPASPSTNLRTYVHGLRRCLGDGTRLLTRPGGYELVVAEGESDLDAFTGLAAQGDAAMRVRDWVMAERCFDRALGLWRGQPGEGLPVGARLQAELDRLAEQRLTIVERRALAAMELGRYEDTAAELRVLVSEHPLREGLWHSLMLTLYRSGRQAESLRAFRDARAILVDTLGVEPGPELQSLHQRILSGDPELAGRKHSVPHQLPAAPRQFVGRDNELRALSEILDAAAGTNTVAITAINGTAGIGKTALALRWAHDVADRFPDGQLYANLRGFDPHAPADPAEVLDGFLRALGIPGESVPVELPALAALFRSTVSGRRLLVILDNARDSAHVRDSGPGIAA